MNDLNELQFEWDEEKAKVNLKKRSVGFDEGATIFNDPLIITITDQAHSDTEQRNISLGISVKGHLLIVVHTERNEKIRLISCRKATPHERKTYDELNK